MRTSWRRCGRPVASSAVRLRVLGLSAARPRSWSPEQAACLLCTGPCRPACALREWHPISLGAKVIDELVKRAGIDGNLVEDVIVGCVSQVGAQAGNIGRNIVLASNLPEHVPGTAVDRQCGSSQQAIHFAAQAVMSGVQDVVIAAGVEHMTGVPIGSNVADAVKAGHGVPNSDEIKAKYGKALEARGQKFFSQVSGPCPNLADPPKAEPLSRRSSRVPRSSQSSTS